METQIINLINSPSLYISNFLEKIPKSTHLCHTKVPAAPCSGIHDQVCTGKLNAETIHVLGYAPAYKPW